MYRPDYTLRTAFLALLLTSSNAHAVEYAYDDLGRLVAEVYPNGTTISYSYDAIGNRLSRTVTVPPPPGPLIFNDSFEELPAPAVSVGAAGE